MKALYLLVTILLLMVSTQGQQLRPPKETALERFLRYAKIDTQSAEDQESVPSTKKQFTLANLLVQELKTLGAQDVRVSESAIVYARLPGNLPDNASVPVSSRASRRYAAGPTART